MSQQSRIVAYLPSLRFLVRRLRRALVAPPRSLGALTGAMGGERQAPPPPPLSSFLDNPFVVNEQFPLPGNGAIDSSPLSSTGTTTYIRVDSSSSSSSSSSPVLECGVQKSPKLLQSSFLELFPDAPSADIRHPSDLMVITLCQKTMNDMTAWTSDVQEERQELLENFIESGKCICGKLTASGYWADFIDPSSGRAFFGETYSASTLFETDDRFRFFGFDIVDLGCCKCISHHLWGMHVFVGVLFTNAPPESPVLRELMQE